ncbi:MAG: carboxymuconolactone decarboxylase family protein [Weeksellaceae bacterium]
MSQRMDYFKVDAKAMKGLMEMEKYMAQSGFDKKLYHLIKLRASQLNGCAYCLDMHAKDALKLGDSVQRLIGLDAWREAPYYTDKERAALEWTEAVTLVAENEVSDEIYENVRKHFSEQELLQLTMGIIAINGWNRLAIPFRTPAGTYEPDN